MGVTEFVSEIKKLVRVIRHDLLGFILKNIECQGTSECESTEATDH